MAERWQVLVSWGFVIAALVALAAAAWFLFLPNPSGDYLTGMGQLFVAIMAGGVAVICLITAGLARVVHTRAGQITAGLFLVALVGAYVALKYMT